MKKYNTRRLMISALFLAVGIYLPSIFHMTVGPLTKVLSPMHLPVLLCGLVCGWQYGLGVGLLTPLLSSLITGMPPLYPVAFAMAAELATYGLVTGLLGRKINVFLSLGCAMVLGRLVYAFVSPALMGTLATPYLLLTSVVSSLVSAWPALLLQIVVVPALFLALDRAHLLEKV